MSTSPEPAASNEPVTCPRCQLSFLPGSSATPGDARMTPVADQASATQTRLAVLDQP